MISSPFSSFFMGGYECADHINRSGERINLLKETQHDSRVYEDYRWLSETGIKTVREGICWSSVEIAPYQYDFREVKNRIEAARFYGIQQIWDLCHFGYPDGLIPTHPHFTQRFVILCEQFARFYRQCTDQVLFVVPINEISFLSWHSGDMRGTVPFAVNSGFDIKYHLCKAAIEGIRALKSVDYFCRIILVEPLVKVHSWEDTCSFNELETLNNFQFQAMDIIGGLLCPELGGSVDNFDILGFNYYYNNQWYHNHGEIPWPDNAKKLEPLSALLVNAYQRYGRPVLLTETGHFGPLRAEWLNEVTIECIKAIQCGVNLAGICIYPVTDRPDWDNLSDYSHCGLMDLDEHKNRIPHFSYISALKICMEKVHQIQQPTQIMLANDYTG